MDPEAASHRADRHNMLNHAKQNPTAQLDPDPHAGPNLCFAEQRNHVIARVQDAPPAGSKRGVQGVDGGHGANLDGGIAWRRKAKSDLMAGGSL